MRSMNIRPGSEVHKSSGAATESRTRALPQPALDSAVPPGAQRVSAGVDGPGRRTGVVKEEVDTDDPVLGVAG